uniref:Uncharacterized protein n=1 Tax=Poecilia mexicana TaxID=48701 RepID=A0A3B3YBG3_9TELE
MISIIEKREKKTNPGKCWDEEWKHELVDHLQLENLSASSSAGLLIQKVCTGYTGIVLKGVGALVALVVIYVIGYVTGYYVHRCP